MDVPVSYLAQVTDGRIARADGRASLQPPPAKLFDSRRTGGADASRAGLTAGAGLGNSHETLTEST
jgi:hypothetical protein